MNFLFTSVLVLLMVAPGLAFFRAYHSGSFSIRYSRLTITDQIFRSIVPAMTGQISAFLLISLLSSYSVNIQTLGIILLGLNDKDAIKSGLTLVSHQLGLLLSYHLTMLMLGALLGWLSRLFVRRFKLDRRFFFLRYDNPYHYLLTGEIFETKDFKGVIELKDAKHIDLIFVDVLVKMDKSNMLYSGILVNYQLATDGGLKSIYLKGAKRKYLTTQKTETPGESSQAGIAVETEPPGSTNPYYPVNGDVLMIPNEQILNLNLTYYIDLEDAKKEGDKQDQLPPPIEINLQSTSSNTQ